jgi:hypothetical protein
VILWTFSVLKLWVCGGIFFNTQFHPTVSIYLQWGAFLFLFFRMACPLEDLLFGSFPQLSLWIPKLTNLLLTLPYASTGAVKNVRISCLDIFLLATYKVLIISIVKKIKWYNKNYL